MLLVHWTPKSHAALPPSAGERELAERTEVGAWGSGVRVLPAAGAGAAGRLSSARSRPSEPAPQPPVRWAAAPRRQPGPSARHGAFAQRCRDDGGGGGPPGGRVQRGGGAGPREEGPPARRHPLPALPGGRHLPLPQHLRAGAGDVRLGLRCAVRGPHRPPRQARVLRLLAEHRGRPHPDPHGHRHGGLDHEHLLGHGHGHPGHFPRLQGAGHPTAAVSPGTPRVQGGPVRAARQHQDLPGCLCCLLVWRKGRI